MNAIERAVMASTLARDFARVAAAVTEALVMEGWPERVARDHARLTAHLIVYDPEIDPEARGDGIPWEA